MQTISYPCNQTTRHSSAARSRLLCDDGAPPRDGAPAAAADEDPLGIILEGPPGGGAPSTTKHRRLASEGPLDDSFLSETETLTSHEWDSDDDRDEDDEGGYDSDEASLASDGGGGWGGPAGAGADSGPIAEEYDEGDLRALNSLVNRLHAAELARERDGRGSEADLAPRRSLSFGDRASYDGGRGRDGDFDDYDDDLPSELPDRPPLFTELGSGTRRSLSYAAVEGYPGPCLEVVPTEDVPSALPRLRQSWSEERTEWKRRRAELLDRRRRSLPAAGGMSRTGSEPLRPPAGASAALRTRSSPSAGRAYRYGRPPTMPRASLPNPMVTRSSKRIHRRHARYALTAGMMLGIRESICGSLEVEVEDEMQAGPSRGTLSESELLEQCEQVSRYKFPPNRFYLGSNTSRPLPHKYKFKVYSPLVFARIRSLFGVDRQEFLHSICGKFNFYEFASNARSGQFFFYSHDGRYMIKTLTHTESKFLREILPHYYRHLTRHPSTILTHFYGMYRVDMPSYPGPGDGSRHHSRLHFIIMRSVFHTEKRIDRVWDLKGSRAGRRAKPGDTVGKDLDVIEEGRRFRFAARGSRRAFLDQLARDATFLARLGIMDYSLLLGLHDCEKAGDGDDDPAPPADGTPATPATPAKRAAGGAAAADGRQGQGQRQLGRSNTPFRRSVLERASSAGDYPKAGDDDDGFGRALGGAPGGTVPSGRAVPPLPDVEEEGRRDGGGGGADDVCRTPPPSSAGPPRPPTVRRDTSVPNAITSRPDSGIEGLGSGAAGGPASAYGADVAGMSTTSVPRREIYFCGVIDILQYYNARKMGETVMRRAAGNGAMDISCVDPETYGKRFVRFVSSLIEEE